MIELESYNNEFEQEYLYTVKNFIDKNLREIIIKSCKIYFPSDFFDNDSNEFKQLILAPFLKLKNAYFYINKNKKSEMKQEYTKNEEKYNEYKNKYSNIIRSKCKGIKLNIRMLEEQGIIICPYCNREYINNRGNEYSGAQMDHFYNKDKFPIFSLCLYNLIPACGNCNRIKSNRSCGFASPFDTEIKWNKSVKFKFNSDGIVIDKILITTSNNQIKKNIKKMKIGEAYQVHKKDIAELQKKVEAYSDSQIQEFIMILEENHISKAFIKQLIFGPPIDSESMKNQSLGKMMHDLHKIFRIYN